MMTSSDFAEGFDAMQQVQEYRREFQLLRRKISLIDPYEVLRMYGARNVSPHKKENGQTELIHSCLIDRVEPHHSNGDENPSASLNAELLKYSCFSYGGGDLLWLIQKMEGTDRRGVLAVLSRLLQGKEQTSEQFLDELERIFVKDQRV